MMTQNSYWEKEETQKKETLMSENMDESDEHRVKTGIIINTLVKKRSTVTPEQEKGYVERERDD